MTQITQKQDKEPLSCVEGYFCQQHKRSAQLRYKEKILLNIFHISLQQSYNMTDVNMLSQLL